MLLLASSPFKETRPSIASCETKVSPIPHGNSAHLTSHVGAFQSGSPVEESQRERKQQQRDEREIVDLGIFQAKNGTNWGFVRQREGGGGDNCEH